MNMHHSMAHKPYLRLFIMAVVSFKIMYLFMYAMVDVWDNVFTNFNQFYMAGLMVSPMVILEVVLMKPMYQKRTWNSLIIALSILFLVVCWTGIRQQRAINDEEFLRSMIPHHGGAILMCNKAKLEDPEIKELCRNIISGQQSEIDWMKGRLDHLENGN